MSRWRPSLGPEVIALAVVVPIVAWLAGTGPRWAGDTPTYAAWADGLIAAKFNVAEFLRSHTFAAPLLLYIGWILIVAIAKTMAGTLWPWVLLAINGLAIWLMARATLRCVAARHTLVAGGIAAAWLAVSPDIWVFGPLLLSDLWFTALTALALTMAIRPVPRFAYAAGFAGLAAITRPTAAPLLLCVLAVVSGAVNWSTRSAVRSTAVAVLVALTVVIVHAWLMTTTVVLPEWFRIWGTRLREHYAMGIVVVERPETFVEPAVTLVGAMLLTLRKWLYFFSPWLPGYSLRHTAVNVLWFAPLYAGMLYAVWRAPHRVAVHALLLFVGLLSGFHALQELDFDQRYRIPGLWAMAALASLSIPAGARATGVDAGN